MVLTLFRLLFMGWGGSHLDPLWGPSSSGTPLPLENLTLLTLPLRVGLPKQRAVGLKE